MISEYKTTLWCAVKQAYNLFLYCWTQPPTKKIAPIVVAGSNATTIQNMLTSVVTSKKFEIKILSFWIRINLTDQDDFAKVKLKLKEMAAAKEIIGFYNYHTADTRPHKIVLFGLYKMTSLRSNNYWTTKVLTQLMSLFFEWETVQARKQHTCCTLHPAQ